MSDMITMGNDEFILYIRKRHDGCSITNDQLGQRIWGWIQESDKTASKGEPVACLWGASAQNLDRLSLPKTATQMTFKRSRLPALYDFLDGLGRS